MRIHNVVQGSESWFSARCGLPTASCFDQILTPKTLKPAKTDYPYKLAAEILAGYDCDEWLGNNATEHGHDSEMFAKKAYFDLTGIEPKDVGFVTNDSGTIGCSPDALAGASGLVEIKSIMAKKVIKIWDEYIQDGTLPTEYKLQIAGQLMITQRSWCDLLLYHPKLDLKVIRFVPDMEIIDKLYDQIDVIIAKRDQIIDSVSEF